MRILTKMLAGAAGAAAIGAAAPATAQYYGYAPYAPYGNAYGYNRYGYNANMTNIAAQRCSAAVQQRLNNRTSMSGIIGSLLGARQSSGRVLSITQVMPRQSTVRVSGLATSGRAYAYNPYGYGAYGAVGYSYQPDLSFRCSVDYNGFIRDIDINRR